MRPVLAFLVIGTLSLVGVQGAAPPQFNSPDSEQAVIVEGCLSGNRLKPELDSPTTAMVFGTLGVKEFRLEATKALLKQHDGHQDEFSGVVYVPRDKNVTVQSRKAGKRTRITGTNTVPDPDPRKGGGGRVADRETTSDSQNKLEARKWARMKVTSVRHVSDKCSVTSKGGLFTRDTPGPN
jgi:hypothetical protein